MKLSISIGEVRLPIDLLKTATAKALLAATPFSSQAQTWGEEVYFGTPVSARLEPDAQDVDVGAACFWTGGDAIAQPFGRTPISTNERPTLTSRCNVIGSVVGDARRLAAVRPGQTVSVEKA